MKNTLSPDDPKITAYALGDLEPGECAEVEAAVAADTALQTAVAEIRATAAQLTAALAAEPAETAGRVVAFMPEPEATRAPTATDREPQRRRTIRSFPYFLVAGLAAACFAFVFVAQERGLDTAARTGNAEPTTATRPTLEQRLLSAGEPAGAPELRDDLALQPDFTLAPPSYEQTPLAEQLVSSAPSTPNSLWFGIGVAGSVGVEAAPPAAPARARAAEPPPEFNTEGYAAVADNRFLAVAQNPLSTFSADVDTASYSNVRRFLGAGRRPPADAVRIEELLNYFTYDYAPPAAEAKAPFAAALEVAAAPWAPQHRLVRIGLKAREVAAAARPPANLVFLIDVSGSMDEPAKLPLVQQSLRALVAKLRPDDRVALVVYAGSSGLALPSTPVKQRGEILAAIDRLHAGGSTNGAMGIHLAYDVARANLVPGGINRVILATDGDFNVGTTSHGELARLIADKAKSGVFLTVLGFGMGNLKDDTMELLADKGNGSYAYLDSAREAQRVLVEQTGGTLQTIARDVKLQVEFNPAQVQAYRLIGYENRLLAREDFANDAVDAGEVGAGHTVTALYEIIPAGVAWKPTASVDPLKYQPVSPAASSSTPQSLRAVGTTEPEAALRTPPSGTPHSALRTPHSETPHSNELLTVKLRYQAPDSGPGELVEFPLVDGAAAFAEASADFKFAAAVAGFGMVLRDSPDKGTATLADVADWAAQGLGDDAGGYRAEFLALVRRAGSMAL